MKTIIVLHMYVRYESSSAPQTGQTALYKACWKGNEKIVDLLIGAGCNIDVQDKVSSLFALYYDSLIDTQ